MLLWLYICEFLPSSHKFVLMWFNTYRILSYRCWCHIYISFLWKRTGFSIIQFYVILILVLISILLLKWKYTLFFRWSTILSLSSIITFCFISILNFLLKILVLFHLRYLSGCFGTHTFTTFPVLLLKLQCCHLRTCRSRFNFNWSISCVIWSCFYTIFSISFSNLDTCYRFLCIVTVSIITINTLCFRIFTRRWTHLVET